METRISPEHAMMLKDMGFNEVCTRTYYLFNGKIIAINSDKQRNELLPTNYCTVPTVQQTRQFLFQEFGYVVGFNKRALSPRYYGFIKHRSCNIFSIVPTTMNRSNPFIAEKDAVERCIELIISNRENTANE